MLAEPEYFLWLTWVHCLWSNSDGNQTAGCKSIFLVLVTCLLDHQFFYFNKNTLTGPANCKKAARHHGHLSLVLVLLIGGHDVMFSTNFRPKTKKIVRAVFEKKIKVSDFGLIWRPFWKYLQIKNFFSKIRLCHFSTFIVP